MMAIVWDPDAAKPGAASDLEAEIARAAPGAEVKLTLLPDGAWLVRALLPSATCLRGRDLASRDVSPRVAALLEDHDLPARLKR
jgi:hypothetical protein